MSITGLNIRLNKGEFSRYEPSRSVVQVRVIPTPAIAMSGESVVVSILKKGITIATQTIIFNGDNPKGMVVPFDLNAITDDNGVPHINHGTYVVTATQGEVSETERFNAVLITADEMRKSYCQGLYLVAGAKLAPVKQPSVVTGVLITNVSTSTKKGVIALVYDSAAQTLTWGGGPATPLTEDSDNEIMLDAKGGYVEIEVDYFSLPSSNAGEGILLDAQVMTDEFISGEIAKATREIEDVLKIKLEPTRVATEPYFSSPPEGRYFDKEAPARAFYSRDFNTRGLAWHLDLPFHQLGQVGDVAGWIGNTAALTLNTGAFAVNRKSGTLDVLPYNSQYAVYWTFFLGINFWGVREYIADFWRYTAIVGLKNGPEPDVLKMVGYAAAISILTTAEQAYRAGMTSESISKDGVTRSQSYNAKGVYDTAINEYKDWNKTNGPKLRRIYCGIPMVVV